MASNPDLVDGIVDQLQDTWPNAEEGEILRISSVDIQSGRDSYTISCYVKLCSDRIYNINALRTILGRV